MNRTVCIIWYFKNPQIPLDYSSISSLKGITPTLKKQYGFKKVQHITNNLELSFLLDYVYQKEIAPLKKDLQTIWIEIVEDKPNTLVIQQTDNLHSIQYSFGFAHTSSIVYNQKKIILRADGGYDRGTGHLYRVLTLSQLLIKKGFKPLIMTLDNAQMNLGKIFFQDRNITFELIQDEQEFQNEIKKIQPHLLILDILNTDKEFIKTLKPYTQHIISFENLGTGTYKMDFTINDLYIHPLLPKQKQLIGLKYALLNQYFSNALAFKKPTFHKELKTILILFGGTDPSHLTQKTLQAIEQLNFKGKVILIQNFQQENIKAQDYSFDLTIYKQVSYMPQYFYGVDLAISSAGRSILELMSMGIPTLCLSQNQKELMHTHNIGSNGILHIGLGSLLTSEIITQYIHVLKENISMRENLYYHALLARKNFSNERILNKILSLLKK